MEYGQMFRFLYSVNYSNTFWNIETVPTVFAGIWQIFGLLQ